MSLLNHRRYQMIVVSEGDGTVTKSVPALKLIVNAPTGDEASAAIQQKLAPIAMSVHAGERKLPKSDALPGQEYLAFDLVLEHDLVRR